MATSCLQAHFDALADALGVDVILVADRSYPNDCWGLAIQHPVHADKRAIILNRRPTKPLPYMVALHELGHCVRGEGWSADRFLDREVAAWEWALEHAKLPARIAAAHALGYMEASAREKGVQRTKTYDQLRRRLKRLAAGR